MTRQEFTESTKRSIYAAQDGRCGDCKEPTPRRRGRFDHIQTCFDGGDNDPSNCRFRCRPCDSKKTYGTHVPLSGDISKIAKTKRLVDRAAEDRAAMRAKRPGRRRRKRGKIRNGKHNWPKRKIEGRRLWT